MKILGVSFHALAILGYATAAFKAAPVVWAVDPLSAILCVLALTMGALEVIEDAVEVLA